MTVTIAAMPGPSWIVDDRLDACRCRRSLVDRVDPSTDLADDESTDPTGDPYDDYEPL